MATRNQAQQRRGGVAPSGKQVKAAAERKNRRALEDIGNLVNLRISEGKPQPQDNRPITRSFGAQLLANAQAAAVVVPAANKKPIDANPVGAAKKGGARAAKQKAGTKPKPEAVIEISSDKDEEVNKQPSSISGSHNRNPSRKKVNTLSSVLTARSKVACGITNKPGATFNDIDASDVGNQFFVSDYVEDIYKFYKLAENASRANEYMGLQVEVTAKMRAIVIDWLIEVHHKFECMPESLYLTICIMDRYLAMEAVLRRELQLVGLSAMLIACKYEEIWAPEVNDFICISNQAYTREQILGMEKRILNKLEWTLTVPTPYMFLVRFAKAALGDKELENMVFFFAELGLMQYDVMITYCPSIFAAAAVYAARCTLKKTPVWTETLKHYTGYSEQQLQDCAKILINCHSEAPKDKLLVVYKKYSDEKFEAVALQPPVANMFEDLKS